MYRRIHLVDFFLALQIKKKSVKVKVRHQYQGHRGGKFATSTAVPEIIDPVFAKTSPKRSFCMTENERFGLVFTKTGSINSGTGVVDTGGKLATSINDTSIKFAAGATLWGMGIISDYIHLKLNLKEKCII
jgi:hypothetical protein